MLTKVVPKISAIIPVYNVAKYLPKCLDSLINQTFANIEIICIDDGSTDNCLQILNEYAQKDNRIIVISQENQGPGVARNRGLEIAKGEYLSFIDPDDWVSLNFYEQLYSEAAFNNYDIVKARKFDVFPNGSVKKEKLFKVEDNNNIQPYIFASSWQCCIYKTSLIRQHNIKFPNNYAYEDIGFLIQFLVFAKSYSLCKNAYYSYIHRQDSLSPKGIYLDKSIDGLNAKMYVFRFLQNCELSKELYIRGIEYFLGTFLYSIELFVINGHYENISLIEPYINEILENLKYKEFFQENVNYKFLSERNFTKEIFDKKNINLKLSKLNFIKKLFYIGNCNDYKIMSILGFKFVFKRSGI